jgi:cytoskeletal protein CcmA (bactofilin family)
MKLFSRRPARPANTGYSVIDDQLSISGDIYTEGTIRVDGRIEGSHHRADTIIIGAGGTVIGNIEAREVIVGGELHGSLSVSGRVEVQASATVEGDIHGHVAIHPIGSEKSSFPTERRLALTPSHAIQAVAQG